MRWLSSLGFPFPFAGGWGTVGDGGCRAGAGVGVVVIAARSARMRSMVFWISCWLLVERPLRRGGGDVRGEQVQFGPGCGDVFVGGHLGE